MSHAGQPVLMHQLMIHELIIDEAAQKLRVSGYLCRKLLKLLKLIGFSRKTEAFERVLSAWIRQGQLDLALDNST